jgi:hypothetical protein
MRKVFDSVNSGDGVAAARGKQARLDIMVRTFQPLVVLRALLRRWRRDESRCLLPQDHYTPDIVTSEIEKRVQVPAAPYH